MYDSSQQWVSPEDALDDLNYICNFGENEKPFQSTECFQVWGRGRQRPPINQIVLPKGTTLQPDYTSERPTRGNGRGRLLLEDSSDINNSKSNSVQTNSVFKDSLRRSKEGLSQRTMVNTSQKVTLKDLEDMFNKAKHLETRKTIFDLNCDFPPLS